MLRVSRSPVVAAQFLASRNSTPDGGEDRLVITDKFIGVCDGATDKSGNKFAQETGQLSLTGGALIADLFVSAMREGMRPSTPQFQAFVEHGLQMASANSRIDLSLPENRPEGSFAIFGIEERVLYLSGDCLVVTVDKFGRRSDLTRAKKVDAITAGIRSKILRAKSAETLGGYRALAEKIMSGACPDFGREGILPFLRRQHLLNGVATTDTREFMRYDGTGYRFGDLAYNAFNGSNPHAVDTVPLNSEVVEILFATDGVPAIKDSLSSTLENLTACLENDPLSAGISLEDTAKFLRELLPKLGLTPKEYNEFIVYWHPRMMKNQFNHITLAGREYSDLAPLETSPSYDTLVRVMMVYKAAHGENASITPPPLPTVPERKGFTVVEWGATEVISAP